MPAPAKSTSKLRDACTGGGRHARKPPPRLTGLDLQQAIPWTRRHNSFKQNAPPGLEALSDCRKSHTLPTMNSRIHHLLRSSAWRLPEKEAIVVNDERWSYSAAGRRFHQSRDNVVFSKRNIVDSVPTCGIGLCNDGQLRTVGCRSQGHTHVYRRSSGMGQQSSSHTTCSGRYGGLNKKKKKKEYKVHGFVGINLQPETSCNDRRAQMSVIESRTIAA